MTINVLSVIMFTELRSTHFENIPCFQVTFQTPFRTPAAAAAPPGVVEQHVPPKGFEDIRELDELENWRERVTVVTSFDHREYVAIVTDLITELVDNLPLSQR